MRKTLSLFLALTLVFCLSVPAAAADDATGTTLRLQETTGTVTVKTSSGQKKSVTKGMRLYNGYIIETGSSSSAFVNLDDTKAVKLGANGKVEIKKSGKQLEVCLSVGELFFNVTEKLASTEKLKISTSTTITGIRGTSGWARQIGSARTQIAILEGNATVTGVAAPDASLTAAPASAEVGAGEKLDVTVSEDGAPAVMETTPIAAGDLSAMVTEQIAVDPKLQEKVSEAMPELNMTELVESLPEKQAEEAAQEAEAQAALDTRSAEQEQTIAETAAEDKAAGVKDTIAFEPARESSGSGGGGSSGGGSSPTSYKSAVRPKTTAELEGWLATYSEVTVPAGGPTDEASEFEYQNLKIPATKTLIITFDETSHSTDPAGGEVETQISGLINEGTLKLDGAYVRLTGNCVNKGEMHVMGSLFNNGALSNSGTISVAFGGVFVNDSGATLTNTGTLNNFFSLVNNRGTISNSYRIFNEGKRDNNSGAFLNCGTLENLNGGSIANVEGMIDNQKEDGNTSGAPAGEILNRSGAKIINSSNGVIINNESCSITNDQGGEIDNVNGVINNKGAFTNSGAFTNGATGTVANNGTFVNEANGTIQNSGTIINSGTITNQANPGYAELGTGAQLLTTGNAAFPSGWGSPATAYTVTFHYGDDEAGAYPEATAIVASGSTVTPPTAERYGYTLLGWHEQGEETNFDFSTQITKDLVLYARWECANSDPGGSTGYVFVTSYDEAKNQVTAIPVIGGGVASGNGSIETYSLANDSASMTTNGVNQWYACTLNADNTLKLSAGSSEISTQTGSTNSGSSQNLAGDANTRYFVVRSSGTTEYTCYNSETLKTVSLGSNIYATYALQVTDTASGTTDLKILYVVLIESIASGG